MTVNETGSKAKWPSSKLSVKENKVTARESVRNGKQSDHYVN